MGWACLRPIAVRKGRAVFLEEHLARMNASMEALEIPGRVTPRWALEELGALFPEKEDGALKLIASGKIRSPSEGRTTIRRRIMRKALP